MPLALAAMAKPKSERPNILLVIANDVPARALGCYGNPEFHTPNLDRFANGGVRFLNAFSPAPTAATSWREMPGALLNQRVGGCRYAYAGPATVAGVEQLTNTHIEFAAKASSFIQKGGEAFFLTLEYPAIASFDAAPFESLYANSQFRGSGYEQTSSRAAKGSPSGANPIANLRRYGAGLSALDAQWPNILRVLIEQKVFDNTLLIFTSLTGSMLGRHGLWGQGDASDTLNFYEESIRVPLLCSLPGLTPAESQIPELVSTAWLTPTTADILGSAPAVEHSFKPLILNQKLPKKHPWQSVVHGRDGDSAYIRDSQYKLVLRHPGGVNELFDIRNDPAESTNQYDNRQFISVQTALTQNLNAWLAANGQK